MPRKVEIFTTEDVARANDQLPPVKPGDVVSWDSHPVIVRENFPNKRGRTFGRVTRSPAGPLDETARLYARISFRNPDDWTEFRKETVKQRLSEGSWELHDKADLLRLIAQAYREEGNEEAATALEAVCDSLN